jgi:hypothetical protein
MTTGHMEGYTLRAFALRIGLSAMWKGKEISIMGKWGKGWGSKETKGKRLLTGNDVLRHFRCVYLSVGVGIGKVLICLAFESLRESLRVMTGAVKCQLVSLPYWQGVELMWVIGWQDLCFIGWHESYQ